MIRAAIVGIGHWGRRLVDSVHAKSGSIRFVAGHTRTRAKVEGFCAERGIAVKDDLDAILADPGIDAVVFATPHSQHGMQVERTAAAGKHVFMEKPFTLDLASAERALDAVARAGVTLAVAYPRRFHPAMIELKTRIDDGRLGRISHCACAQTSPTGLTMPPDYWRSDPREAPVGPMTANGVHNLDALIYLFGAIDEVYCTSLRRVMPRLEDTTTVLLGLANGISATLYCSLVTAPSWRFAVYGSEGCVELAGRDVELRFTPTSEHAQVEAAAYRGFDGQRAELEGFAAAIAGERPYPITADEVLHGVAVFAAVVRSAALRQPVKLASGR
jgi:predicted dehydrogenase